MEDKIKEELSKNNINYFKNNSEIINPNNIHNLLEMCVFNDCEEIFDYLLTFEFSDVSYDDSCLFNYSIEVGRYNFTKKLSKLAKIDICNDDCWCLKFVTNNKIEALDYILQYEDILNYPDEEWIEQNIYNNEKILIEKIKLYKKKLNIKHF